MKIVQEIIAEYEKLAKDVEEAINNPDISFSDGVESMKAYIDFLNQDIKNIN